MSTHDKAFFGLHFDIHANARDKELGRDVTVEHLMRQFEKVRPDFVQCDCKGHPGYASYPTKVGTPAPGIVKDALKVWREATRRMGLPLLMHFSGVYDIAAIAAHPEWARVKGEKEAAGGDRLDPNNTCPLSGYTDEYMTPQMLELVREYGVDGFWVDGECWASRPCYCARCVERFREKTGCEKPPESPEEPLWEQWLAFSRDNFVDHVRRYANAIHALNPNVTVCSNWMYSMRMPEEIEAPIDYVSGDFSWVWSCETAIAEGRLMDGRGIKWDLMAWGFTSHGPMADWEFKTAQALCQEAACVLSAGGAFSVYDTPNRTGNVVEWHMDELAEVSRFCHARQPYCEGTKALPQAVALHNPDHYYALAQDGFYVTAHGSTRAVEGALHALLDNQIPTEILNADALSRRLGEYPLVVLGDQTRLPDTLTGKLEAYVREGGSLVISGTEAARTLAPLLGVEIEGEVEGGTPSLYAQVGRQTTILPGTWLRAKCVDAEPLAELLLSRDLGEFARPSGCPVATKRTIGKGAVIGIYGDVFTDYRKGHYPRLRALLGSFFEALNARDMVRVSSPAGLQVSVRARGDAKFVHLVNLSVSPAVSPSYTVVEEVPSMGRVHVSVPCERRPEKVYLAPGMQPLTWTWEAGRVEADVAQVGIHEILVVE